MATYPRMTPHIGARGKFTVRLPFRVADNQEYKCVAVRSFDDMYRDGINPYDTIYLPSGLVDGSVQDGHTFNYASEQSEDIHIVTLMDKVGRFILVPDNYITGYPEVSDVEYLEYILSTSVGALPKGTDMSDLVEAVKDAVADQYGIDIQVQIHTLPTLTTPTHEQHVALEEARKARIKIGSDRGSIIRELIASNDVKDKKIAGLTKILVDNNLLP